MPNSTEEEVVNLDNDESTEDSVKQALDNCNLEKEQLEENIIEVPKTSWLWLKNSNGEASASITFLFIAFWVTTFVFVLAHIGQIHITDKFHIEFNGFDSTAAAVYYVPLMMLYFKRREFESEKPSRPGILDIGSFKKIDNNSKN